MLGGTGRDAARSRRAARHQPGPATAPCARVEPDRAALAAPSRTPALPSPARRRRPDPRGMLRGLEYADTVAHPLTHGVPPHPEDRLMRPAVSHRMLHVAEKRSPRGVSGMTSGRLDEHF